MRSLALTGLVAVAVGAGALAAAWSVEAAALPSPPSGARAAVDALVVLDHHRVALSAFQLEKGPVLHGTCARGWFPARGTLLTLSDGTRVFVGARADAAPNPVATAELELAGCPRPLGSTVARLLQRGAKVLATRAWLGRPVIAVRIRSRASTLTVYVTPRHFVPVGVALASPFVSGRSRVRFVRG